MYFSYENNYIYFHIPKCAGTSISSNLKEYYNGKNKHKHGGAKLAKEFFFKKKWNSFFKFSFVRNPYDRMVSWYEHLIRNKFLINKKVSFKDFLKDYDSYYREDKRNVSFKENQYDFILADEMQFIGRFENLENDWKKLLKILNFKYYPLKWINKNENKKNYHKYYDNWSRNYVSSIFQKDIEYFNYKF